MDDPYKCMLANASRKHLLRQSHINSQLVGNVFLPAINNRTNNPSVGSSMQHLKIIEQCIIAENRREAKLATCQSDRERRYWTKKFQVQRKHESKLVQAMMACSGGASKGEDSENEADLRIVAIDAGSPESSTKPPPSMCSVVGQAGNPMTELTASITSPDHYFHKGDITDSVPKAKPHIRKKLTLPDYKGGSPQRVKQQLEGVKPFAMFPSPSMRESSSGSLTKKISPARGTQSAASTRKEAEPKGPNHNSNNWLSPSLAKSPLKNGRFPTKNSTKVSPKRKVVLETSVNGEVTAIEPMCVHEMDTGLVPFEGATSFLDARQMAMRAISQSRGLVDKGTSTELLRQDDDDRTDNRGDNPLLFTRREDGDTDTHQFSLSYNGSTSSTAARRSHSSPSFRIKCDLDEQPIILKNITSNMTCSSELLPSKELSAHHVEEVKNNTSDPHLEQTEPVVVDDGTDPSDEQRIDIPMEDHSIAHGDRKEQQDEFPPAEESNDNNTNGDDVEKDSDTIRHDQGDIEATTTITSKCDEADSKMDNTQDSIKADNTSDHLHHDAVGKEQPVTLVSKELSEEQEIDVAEVLFDLVDQIEAMETLLSSQAPANTTEQSETMLMISSSEQMSARSRYLASFSHRIIHIQAMFRGHLSRRAFRLALYQQALNCGVLGAMPGTTQGKTGWYQDPKSLLAYYFEVKEDGEWKQKLVLRCSHLILTSYDMYQDILSKVFLPSDGHIV